MKKTLNGFMGRTHVILSICLLFIVLLLPIDKIADTVAYISNDPLLFVITIVLVAGGALLPDLDNVQSSAGSTLGVVGSAITIFMQTTSAAVWALYHGKRDGTPMTQHRYLWHTPFVAILIILGAYFGIAASENTIMSQLNADFIVEQPRLAFYILLIFLAILCGCNAVIVKLLKFVHIPAYVKYVVAVLMVIYTLVVPISKVRICAIAVGCGYLFHILEDLFADTGIPLIWPIPAFWCKKVWWRAHSPLPITTGGLVNSIIDLVGIIVAIGLCVIYIGVTYV